MEKRKEKEWNGKIIRRKEGNWEKRLKRGKEKIDQLKGSLNVYRFYSHPFIHIYFCQLFGNSWILEREIVRVFSVSDLQGAPRANIQKCVKYERNTKLCCKKIVKKKGGGRLLRYAN